jgi:type IV secretion system protein VirB5
MKCELDMKRHLTSLLFSCLLCLTLDIHAQGIPVFDAKGVAQALETVSQLKQQLSTLQQQYNAIIGTRNLGDILNNPALRQYLPSDWANIYDQVKSGKYQGISGAATAIKDMEKLYSNNTGQQRVYDTVATNKAMTQEAYKNAMARLDNIQSLMQKINTTQDTKAAADLQNRLSAENAMIQNEQTRLNLMFQLQQAEEKLAEQQRDNDFRAKYFR